jgi:hypothetical protein
LATGYVLSKKEEQLILKKLKSGRCLTSLVAPLDTSERISGENELSLPET